MITEIVELRQWFKTDDGRKSLEMRSLLPEPPPPQMDGTPPRKYTLQDLLHQIAGYGDPVLRVRITRAFIAGLNAGKAIERKRAFEDAMKASAM